MADRANALARDLASLPQPEAQVEAAWWRIANRPPSPAERSESLAFLAAAAPPSALPDFCHALLSSSAFLYLE